MADLVDPAPAQPGSLGDLGVGQALSMQVLDDLAAQPGQFGDFLLCLSQPARRGAQQLVPISDPRDSLIVAGHGCSPPYMP